MEGEKVDGKGVCIKKGSALAELFLLRKVWDCGKRGEKVYENSYFFACPKK